MLCPHCKKSINPKLIKSEAARLNRGSYAPTPRKLSPCPWCGELCGARELRKHKPACAKNPRNSGTSPKRTAGASD